jgi:hypothetical protein
MVPPDDHFSGSDGAYDAQLSTCKGTDNNITTNFNMDRSLPVKNQLLRFCMNYELLFPYGSVQIAGSCPFFPSPITCKSPKRCGGLGAYPYVRYLPYFALLPLRGVVSWTRAGTERPQLQLHCSRITQSQFMGWVIPTPGCHLVGCLPSVRCRCAMVSTFLPTYGYSTVTAPPPNRSPRCACELPHAKRHDAGYLFPFLRSNQVADGRDQKSDRIKRGGMLYMI